MNNAHFASMDMNLLRIFDMVYMEKSVTVAADRLGVTQSAVSHGLRKLREIFDDELFLRSGQIMAPTIRAQLLYKPVRQIMSTLTEEILPITTFDAATAHREFSLVMGDMAEMVFLPPLIRRVRKVAPNCTLRSQRIHSDSMMEALEKGDAELAIGNMPEAHSNFYSQTLFEHDYVVLAWKRHPRIDKRLTWKAYAREEHVVVTSGLDVNLERITLAPLGIKRKVVLTIGGFLSVPWLIQGTELLATVPSRLGVEISGAADVKQLTMPTPVARYGLQSVWHPRWHKDAGHRWLRGLLFDLMRNYPNVT